MLYDLYVFRHAMALLCPENTVLLQMSITYGSNNLSFASFAIIIVFWKPGRKEYDIDVPFSAEHSIIAYSLNAEQLWFSVVITI